MKKSPECSRARPFLLRRGRRAQRICPFKTDPSCQPHLPSVGLAATPAPKAGSGQATRNGRTSIPPGDIDGNFGGNTANTDMSGALWGGQIGCDYQGGQWFLGGSWVLGVQGMLAGSTVTGTNQDQFNATWALRDRIDRVSSVTGRLGTTIADRTLVYCKDQPDDGNISGWRQLPLLGRQILILF